MNAISTRVAMFLSRGEQWRDVRGFVEVFCDEAGIPKEACRQCQEVLEKLFLHTVEHGHPGGSDAPIWIRLSAEGDHVSLAYEDRAKPFNPFPGGPGQYAYLFGRNRIQLLIA